MNFGKIATITSRYLRFYEKTGFLMIERFMQLRHIHIHIFHLPSSHLFRSGIDFISIHRFTQRLMGDFEKLQTIELIGETSRHI